MESNAYGAGAFDFARNWYRGKKVVVTGGTSGIGAAVARAFLAAGAEVIAAGVPEREVAAAAHPELGRADLRALDVRDHAAVEALFAGLDRLDVLFNGAGVIRRDGEHEPDIFDDVIAINLSGAMRCATAARPLLARSKGSIVNVASMLTYFGSAVAPAYASSKGAIGQLTRSLALAYAADGIRVNAIAPGWVATPLTSALREDPAREAAILSRTALKRWARPEEMAGAVLFLASPIASYITGSILPIDGGYLSA